MDNASLISRDSFSSTTPSRRHRFKASLTNLTKSLDRQDSKASLQSRATTSSGSSRWLVPWFPKIRNSIDDSRNGSTTPVVYPDRDSTRLQLVALTSTGTATSQKGVPCLPPGFQEIDIRQHTRSSNLVESSLPLTLQEKALMSIARNVELYAKELDRNFEAAMSYVEILHTGICEYYASERIRNQQEAKKQINGIFNGIMPALGKAVSIYIATYLFSVEPDTEKSKSLPLLFKCLCQREIQKLHRSDMLCSTALAFTNQPDRSSELAQIFQQCLFDNLLKFLPHMSLAVMYSRIEYCLTLVNIGDKPAARLVWERISFDDLSSILDEKVHTWLLGELAVTAYRLNEYETAKNHFTLLMIHEDWENYETTCKARIWNKLADCNYCLGLHETALAQATVARTLLDGVNEINDGVKMRKEEVQDLIADINKAMSKKSAVATAPTLPHPTQNGMNV